MTDLKKFIRANLDNVLTSDFFLPELGRLRRGKIRDLYFKEGISEFVTDRVSAFDVVSEQGIPFKGEFVNRLNVAGHLLSETKLGENADNFTNLGPNVNIRDKLEVYPIEIIVRRRLLGSGFRSYQARQEISGVKLPPGLNEGDRFEEPIITPTTKAHQGHDEEISKEEIIAQNLVPEEELETVYEKAMTLFLAGEFFFDSFGIPLDDTKYEFSPEGVVDEIHTPDSSRFNGFDKEYLRRYLRENGYKGEGPMPHLPEEVIIGLSLRYLKLIRKITPDYLPSTEPVKEHLIDNLRRAGLYKGRFVPIIMGSKSDLEHAKKIEETLTELDIPSDIRVASGHKSTEHLLEMIRQYNRSSEPLLTIACAGGWDDLSGVVASNSVFPMLSSPPDGNYQGNYPSGCPVARIPAKSAALAAAKSFAMHDPEYRRTIEDRIREVEEKIIQSDTNLE